MRVVVDFEDPVNDLDVFGLAEGAEPGAALGRSGPPAWRLFSSAVRVLFLVRQDSPVARQALERELTFIEERLRELRGGSPRPSRPQQRGRR